MSRRVPLLGGEAPKPRATQSPSLVRSAPVSAAVSQQQDTVSPLARTPQPVPAPSNVDYNTLRSALDSTLNMLQQDTDSRLKKAPAPPATAAVSEPIAHEAVPAVGGRTLLPQPSVADTTQSSGGTAGLLPLPLAPGETGDAPTGTPPVVDLTNTDSAVPTEQVAGYRGFVGSGDDVDLRQASTKQQQPQQSAQQRHTPVPIPVCVPSEVVTVTSSDGAGTNSVVAPTSSSEPSTFTLVAVAVTEPITIQQQHEPPSEVVIQQDASIAPQAPVIYGSVPTLRKSAAVDYAAPTDVQPHGTGPLLSTPVSAATASKPLPISAYLPQTGSQTYQMQDLHASNTTHQAASQQQPPRSAAELAQMKESLNTVMSVVGRLMQYQKRQQPQQQQTQMPYQHAGHQSYYPAQQPQSTNLQPQAQSSSYYTPGPRATRPQLSTSSGMSGRSFVNRQRESPPPLMPNKRHTTQPHHQQQPVVSNPLPPELMYLSRPVVADYDTTTSTSSYARTMMHDNKDYHQHQQSSSAAPVQDRPKSRSDSNSPPPKKSNMPSWYTPAPASEQVIIPVSVAAGPKPAPPPPPPPPIPAFPPFIPPPMIVSRSPYVRVASLRALPDNRFRYIPPHNKPAEQPKPHHGIPIVRATPPRPSVFSYMPPNLVEKVKQAAERAQADSRKDETLDLQIPHLKAQLMMMMQNSSLERLHAEAGAMTTIVEQAENLAEQHPASARHLLVGVREFIDECYAQNPELRPPPVPQPTASVAVKAVEAQPVLEPLLLETVSDDEDDDDDTRDGCSTDLPNVTAATEPGSNPQPSTTTVVPVTAQQTSTQEVVVGQNDNQQEQLPKPNEQSKTQEECYGPPLPEDYATLEGHIGNDEIGVESASASDDVRVKLYKNLQMFDTNESLMTRTDLLRQSLTMLMNDPGSPMLSSDEKKAEATKFNVMLTQVCTPEQLANPAQQSVCCMVQQSVKDFLASFLS